MKDICLDEHQSLLLRLCLLLQRCFHPQLLFPSSHLQDPLIPNSPTLLLCSPFRKSFSAFFSNSHIIYKTYWNLLFMSPSYVETIGTYSDPGIRVGILAHCRRKVGDRHIAKLSHTVRIHNLFPIHCAYAVSAYQGLEFWKMSYSMLLLFAHPF